ncbi:MAG: sulfite exporter TauE/SafE family protein [Chthoniobacteraceae bacterium]
MPSLTAAQWLIAVVAGLGVGVAKSGFAGVSLVHVLVMAHIFGDKASTGVVLPMLCIGDIFAVLAFKRHAIWRHVARTLPVACIGVAVGTWLMTLIPPGAYKPIIGWTVLTLVIVQLWRMWRPEMFEKVPHSLPFAATMGLLAGITTMMANAAGPVMGLYFLSVGLPKYQLTGTSAWFFLLINFYKIPFSIGLGLIHTDTLLFNLVLAPAILAGLFLGRWLLHHVPQRVFDGLILAFAAVAALQRIGVF